MTSNRSVKPDPEGGLGLARQKPGSQSGRKPLVRIVAFLGVVLVLIVLWQSGLWNKIQSGSLVSGPSTAPDTLGGRIADAALWQIDKTVRYDPAYVRLDYPMGDLPLETGVCTDVVIRALRRGAQIDLQQRVHEDMKAHFSVYPTIWGLKKPDLNIDHRRVPNLQVYMERAGFALPLSQRPEDYQAGDIVTCKLPHGRDHIMIVSYQKSWKGTPLTIHNAGGGTGQNDCLFSYKLTGHYRIGRATQ